MEWKFVEGLRYTQQHEWVRQEDGGIATVGVTDYAQDQLGKIVFVELPEAGREVQKGENIVVLESVKTIADVYAPVGGTIAAVNEELLDTPELINEDPYQSGWIVTISPDNPGELEQLMSREEYESFVREQEEGAE